MGCFDLGISPLDPVTLVIAFRCHAERMGLFTREEFMSGMTSLECDEVGKLRAKLDELRRPLLDKVALKEIYAYTFRFALDAGQRCLPVGICVELWKLLLP